jgi:putative transposase
MKIRKPNRLPGYDYSKEGIYFITICSKERECIFARVGAGLASAPTNEIRSAPTNEITPAPTNEIELTEIGQIIQKQWHEIPKHFDSVSVDEFVIMPNHIHGIVVIKKRTDAKPGADARPAPTLGDIVCSFKSKCTVEYLDLIKKKNLNVSGKIWQSSFYDHIIQDERSLDKIREYIRNNPARWGEDKNNLSYNNDQTKFN